VASLTAFNSQQLAALTQLSQQMMSDSSKMQAAAKEFKEDVETLTTENLKTVTPA
jgi:phasin family protein